MQFLRKIFGVCTILALVIPQSFIFAAAPAPSEIPNYIAKPWDIGPFGRRDWDARGNYFAWSEFPGNRAHQTLFAGDQKLEYANLVTGEVFDVTDANQNITELKMYDNGIVWASKGVDSEVAGLFRYDFSKQEVEQIQAGETTGAISIQTTPDGQFVMFKRGLDNGSGKETQYIVGPDGSEFPLADFAGGFDMLTQYYTQQKVPNAAFVGSDALVLIESSGKGSTVHVKKLSDGTVKDFIIINSKIILGTAAILSMNDGASAYIVGVPSGSTDLHIFKFDITTGTLVDTSITVNPLKDYVAGTSSIFWKDKIGYNFWNLKNEKSCAADVDAKWNWDKAPRFVLSDNGVVWENGDSAFIVGLQCRPGGAPLPPPVVIVAPPTAQEIPNFSLVRSGRGLVYFIANDRKKYRFPDDKTLGTWFSGKPKIISLSAEKIKLFPDGGVVTYRPGVRLIHKKGDAKIFAVDKNGALRWIRRPSVLVALFGDKWSTLVDQFDAAQLGAYHMGATIETANDYNRAQIMQATRYINFDKDIK